MRVVSFVEGARLGSGGVGLVGVPSIARSIAERGHHVVLVVAGDIMPGAERFGQSSPDCIFHSLEGTPAFGIIPFPALGRWAFSPSLFTSMYRYVCHADFVTLHSLYSFPVLAGYAMARLAGKPYGVWPHGVLAPFQRRVSAKKKRAYDLVSARSILNDASVLFYSATGERDEAAPLRLRAPSVIVPHGIDLGEFSQLPARGQFRARYLGGHQGPLVLYLGRLNAKKGLDLLVAAFSRVVAQLPEARLAIVGAGDPPSFESQVDDWLRRWGIAERTVMPGLIAGDQKLSALADADVFVLPSHAENFCFAMFEAMAARVPVVIADSLNLAPEVERWEAGLVLRRDPEAFASGMLELLVNEELRRSMGERGLCMAKSYSWHSTGVRVEKTMKCIMEGMPLPAELTMDVRSEVGS